MGLRWTIVGLLVAASIAQACEGVRSDDTHLLPIARLPAPSEAEAGQVEEALPPMDETPPGEGGETLEQAWAIAERMADRLAAAQLQWSAAESTRAATEAQRWPNLELDSFYFMRSNEPSFVVTTPGTGATRIAPYEQSEYLTLRSAVHVPVFTGGRLGAQIDASKAAAEAARLNSDVARRDLKMIVAEEYSSVLRAEGDVEVARSNVASLSRHVREVAVRCEHAHATRYDLLSAEVALANAKHAATQIENRLKVARATYNRRLGRDLSAPVQLVGLPVGGEPDSLEVATELALGHRQELQRYAADAAALRAEAEAIRAQNRPQLGLSGEFAYRENQFQSPQGLAAVGVGGSWSVFDAGEKRHRAEALLRQAESVMRLRADLESSIRLEVQQAWLDVYETRERIRVTQGAIEQSEESLRLARQRYNSGTGKASDILDAESQRSESRKNYLNARCDSGLASIRLERALGRL
jgi:outer membrane protein TolC